MQIRSRLTYQFVAIVAFIQMLASVAVYLNTSDYRERSYYEQLKASAMNRTVLLMELEGLEPERLDELRELGASSLIDEHFFIYNFKNELLYNSGSDSSLIIPDSWLDEIRLNKEARFEAGGHELAGLLFADRYNRLVVICAGRDEIGLQQLVNLRRVLVVVYLFSLLFLSWLAWLYAGQALRPISRIVSKVDRITFVNLHERLDPGDTEDELSRLSTTFNNMLNRIEGSMHMQRNFVANASHELRTPLTAMQGQLEVLLLKKRSAAEYQESIQSVLDDIKKLTDISNRLLMLAQADSAYTPRLFSEVSLADILWECQAELQKHYPQARVHISLDEAIADMEDLQLKGNQQLLHTVFINLIQNGIKFSNQREVYVDVKKTPGKLWVKVKDEGIGIPADELEQVFQPFFRSSNAQSIQGHGIGLSLVERIVRLHQGEIGVQSQLGKGTSFTLSFDIDKITTLPEQS
ncbi:MAG: sensor histidine kinase [Bacteroidia bacterium]